MSAQSNTQFEYAFVPITNKQRDLFNFKDLSKQLDKLVAESTDKIYALEEISKEAVKEILLNSIKATYFADEEKQKQKEKGRKEKAQSQAPSSYIIFYNEVREQVLVENPNFKIGDMGRFVGEKWGKLSEAEKEVYKNKSKQIEEQIKAGTYVKPVKAKKAKASTSNKDAQKEGANNKSASNKPATSKDANKSASTKADAPKADAVVVKQEPTAKSSKSSSKKQ